MQRFPKNLDAIGALSERTVDKFQNTSVISKNDEWKPMLNQGSMVTSPSADVQFRLINNWKLAAGGVMRSWQFLGWSNRVNQFVDLLNFPSSCLLKLRKAQLGRHR